MINTNNVGGESYKDFNQLPEAGLINETLPFEIFTRVLSYLDGMDVKQASLVSHLWSETAIDSAKRKEFALIKKYAQEIAERLIEKPYAEQKKALQAIGGDTKILDSVNLIEVKSSVGSLKETIVNILKGLPVEKLEALEDLRKPPFFEDVLVLAKIYRSVDEFIKMPSTDQRTCLERINSLLEKGLHKKALEVVLAIPAQDVQVVVINSLFSQRTLEQAGDLLPLLPENVALKDGAYEGMVHGRMFLSELDEAEKFALLIMDENKRIKTLAAVISGLINSGRFDRIEDARALLQKMQFQLDKDGFCCGLAFSLKDRYPDEAKEFASLINDEDLRSKANMSIGS